MFGFASPTQSHLGSIASRAGQVQAAGQQQIAGQQQLAGVDAGFGAPAMAAPPPQQGAQQGAPQGSPQQDGQGGPQSGQPAQQQSPSVMDLYHRISSMFGGGSPSQSANPYADMNAGIDASAAAQADPVNMAVGAGSDLGTLLASLFGA